MQKYLTAHQNLSPAENEIPAMKSECSKNKWEEYSSFHDSFTELLSYENSRKSSSDFWQLNYI